MKTEPLKENQFYHIYTHGVGGRNLFKDADNYEYFLQLYDRYIEPVAETFAWALMPNHVHFLIKPKANICYKYSNADGCFDADRFNEIKWETMDLSAIENPDNVKVPKVEKHLSHLFNAYARHFNTKYQYRGTLFERPFKRKYINNIHYLRRVVLYIHNNPIHHGFCSHPVEYPWTSYLSCLSLKPTKLKRKEVAGWFTDQGQFKAQHDEKLDFLDLDYWLEL